MIGIDLGTTNSLVAVMKGGRAEVLPNELGEFLTPSVVAVAEDGQLLVGRAAKDRWIVDPQSGRAHFKRDMGTSASYQLGKLSLGPVECSSVVLRELKRVAEMQLGEEVREAVISVPAYFRDEQRQATLEAAKLAGLEVMRIVNEPTAAALAYGYANPESEQLLLVFDLGGGTFDVTLLEIFDGVIEVRASSGESHLGGEDYTDGFLKAICEENQLEGNEEEMGRWRQLAEVAKRRLSLQSETLLELRGKKYEVSRQTCDRATAELTARLRPVIHRCLRDAGVESGELDDVLFIGGASRMGVVRDYLRTDLGRFPNQKLDPDQVVALGAAVQAALCREDEAVGDLVLTDVAPHTLGVEISREMIRNQIKDGFFSPIIDRNTTIPTSRSSIYTTMRPDQDEIHLMIFQGEARKTSENQKIGDIRVKGLRTRAGQEQPGMIEVRFSYDMNGILEVDVTVLSTGKVYSKVIEQRPGTLTPRQLEEALKKLAPLKIRPKDLLPNRARIERANRLFTELIGPGRDRLDFALAQFETALDAQNDEDIKVTAAILDGILKEHYSLEGEIQPDSPEGP